MPAKITREQFIQKAIELHGDLYDYSLVEYEGNSIKVKIGCKTHGVFEKSPGHHLRGQGCRICKGYVALSKESFVERSLAKHGDKYDYSQVDIKSKNQKVEIVCPSHGLFYQLPLNHIAGQGCPQCGQNSRAVSQRYSKDQFIEGAIIIHGNYYDYSELNYVNSQSKVKIGCPIHGFFNMKANSHANGQGCPKCGRISAREKIKLEYSEFLKRAIYVHGDKYKYEKDSYIDYTTKLNISCVEHGVFQQTPHSHISMSVGCPKCGIISAAKANEKGWGVVLDMFKSVHGSRYTYDDRTFVNVTSKMRIYCEEHGWFLQNPNLHYTGSGCKQCGYVETAEKTKINFESFLERSKKVHGERYQYDNNDWVDIFSPVTIICKKHGDFLQNPRNHYRGSGCPKCNSSRGESIIRAYLIERRVDFEEQKVFEGLIHRSPLKCDFFIPSLNAVIEYNGIQHYEPIEVFGGEKGHEDTRLRDEIKYSFLNRKGVHLIVVRYDIDSIEHLLDSELLRLSK
jgi:ssDNA-binding Zn-finger/Zn-ribbon topoisomerase 1